MNKPWDSFCLESEACKWFLNESPIQGRPPSDTIVQPPVRGESRPYFVEIPRFLPNQHHMHFFRSMCAQSEGLGDIGRAAGTGNNDGVAAFGNGRASTIS